MSIDTLPAPAFRFDNPPVDSILDSDLPVADKPPRFPGTGLVLEEIRIALCSGNEPRALALIDWLLRNARPLSDAAASQFAAAFRNLVPNQPRPLVDAALYQYPSMPMEIVELLATRDNADALHAMEVRVYRLYECRGEFRKARDWIDAMLKRRHSPFARARLCVSRGDQFLFEGDYRHARPCYASALEIFAGQNCETEAASARADLLTCDFALGDSVQREALGKHLMQCHRALSRAGDWRRRKTLRLLAARAEARRRLAPAVRWARAAVAATADIETRLRDEDRDYLKALRGKLKRQYRMAEAYGQDYRPSAPTERAREDEHG